MSLSLSFFSLSLTFFDRYKNGTPCAPTLASRCLVSFVPFSARFGFALRAFNLFAPSPYTSLYIWLCMCVCVCSLRFVYVSYWFSTNTHTHARLRTHSHILTMMGREAHREGGWKNDRDRERERRSPYILAHKMVVMLSVRYMTVGGQIYSRISFRSDDDNDDIPSSSISTQLRRYDFSSSSISTINCSYCYCCRFFPYRYNNDYNSYRFLCQYMNVYASPETVKMCHASLQ